MMVRVVKGKLVLWISWCCGCGSSSINFSHVLHFEHTQGTCV